MYCQRILQPGSSAVSTSRRSWPRVSLSAFAALAALLNSASGAHASTFTQEITISNPSFETPFSLGDNVYNFHVQTYDGWAEYDLPALTPSAAGANNVGPYNTPASDIPEQATAGDIALYAGDTNVRTDQTTGYTIGAHNTAFTLKVDVGRDNIAPYGGYAITLYAENAGVKTTIKEFKTSDAVGDDPAGGTYTALTKSLTAAELTPYVGQKLGVAFRKEAAGRDVFYDSVALTATASGVALPVKNAGFDQTSLGGPNSYDFVGTYNGWKEVDLAGADVVGGNVGPIWISSGVTGDILTGATSSVNGLYAGNNAVRVHQTTIHKFSSSDASITLAVDVGNDSATSPANGDYEIQIYADNGGTKTVLKTINSAGDPSLGDPADGQFARRYMTVNAADYAAYLGQKVGISLRKASGSGRDPFFDTVTLNSVTQGTQIPLINPGFDDTSGLSISGSDTYDFSSSYSGWMEVDGSGTPVVGSNVGPIYVGSDIPGGATSPNLALYLGNFDIRVQQTSNHVIAANDTSFRLSVDVGNDLVDTAPMGGYILSLYAENGGGVKTLIKTMTASAEEFIPGDGTFLTLALDLAPSEFSAFIGQKIGISLGRENTGPGSRDPFFDSVQLTFTAIPEPGSGLLLALGGVAAIGGARRRRRGARSD